MSRGRLLAVSIVLGVAASAVLARSAQVSVLEHTDWTTRAFEQQEATIEIQSPRGRILSSDGHLFATSIRRWAIQVDQKNLQYPKLFAAAASPLIGEKTDVLLRKLSNGPRYLWLAKDLSHEQALAVRDLERSAIGLVPHWARVYPLGRTAAPTIGFVGLEELRLEGRSGLESYYETLLVGEPDRCLFVKDAHGRYLQLERIHRGRAGYDLELTLSARIQQVAESAIETAVKAHGAESGSAVVLDARSGDLLALASVPFSDRPSTGVRYDKRCWALRPVQSALEPGSTIKPFIAAVGLASNAVRPGEIFDCSKRGIMVGNTWIRDHAEPDRYTLDEVVIHSSNAGIIQVAERVDDGQLWDTLHGLGFGRRPELGFPSESTGLLWPVSRWTTMSRSGLALGQELTVSPLQLALAYAAIANGGWLPEGRLVNRMVGRDESTGDRVRPRIRIMDTGLSHRLTSMLEGVVDRGTGMEARVPGYRVAGKTGTAQMVVDGTFDDEHHTSWFAGFLPLPNPRWVIVVAIENPQDDYWASSVAAPVFAQIAEATLTISGMPPTDPPPSPAGGEA